MPVKRGAILLAHVRPIAHRCAPCAQAILSDPKCWVEHMQLNQSTGLDPDGVMLRASEGLAAVDFLMPSYYVWAKIIEAFADLGYDPNTLVGVSYDWRLSIANMERRDHYFSRLRTEVEQLHRLNGEKVCRVPRRHTIAPSCVVIVGHVRGWPSWKDGCGLTQTCPLSLGTGAHTGGQCLKGPHSLGFQK